VIFIETIDIKVLYTRAYADPSQAAFMNVVKNAKEINHPVVVAGCVSQADRKLPGKLSSFLSA
jgi:hypothetical protein